VACCCGYAHGTHNGSCGWRATVQYDGAVLSVIPLSPADDDAVRIVQRHRVNRLAETQKRGQNWLAGNAAILALLGSAVIFQAPDDIRKLRTGASVLVLVLAIAGLAALAVSIYFAYAAAYGSVNGTRVDQLIDADRSDYRGLSTALEQAVHADVASSRRNLVCAVWLAIAGVVVVALAAALAGVLPQEKSHSSSGGGMCLKAGTAIINVGTAPDVVSAGTVTYAECPKK
jgi:NhaP-type Na+/H+ or K+/H+ antiporter